MKFLGFIVLSVLASASVSNALGLPSAQAPDDLKCYFQTPCSDTSSTTCSRDCLLVTQDANDDCRSDCFRTTAQSGSAGLGEAYTCFFDCIEKARTNSPSKESPSDLKSSASSTVISSTQSTSTSSAHSTSSHALTTATMTSSRAVSTTRPSTSMTTITSDSDTPSSGLHNTPTMSLALLLLAAVTVVLSLL
ncbi:hypothetical protein BJ085DRAFT_38826 [Dimargaris cristalligena]|uniref:Extracellular membrane protein CFEM domain-containing protein n=1 Tax=Dimargaris cristalligena TaxID=215637 RepID=A0A4Q0A1P2_9FUNG|nr:hypothetical protein BJ085DRAFT_38826 [Dimargaris cristalligena]|eukprot:RKP40003.1 hypothetical protein BJ085DRAFT_38826 [Dimargaris cristalligena]